MLYHLEYAGKVIGTYKSWSDAQNIVLRMVDAAQAKLNREKMYGNGKTIVAAHNLLRRVQYGIQVRPAQAQAAA